VIYNDTEQGRHSLAVSISQDEGKTFKWTRHLEYKEPGQGGSFSYPSIIQTRDGLLHATYTYNNVGQPDARENGKTIKHAAFNKAWVMQGDPE
jgi:predicted neuraminidase